MFTSLRMRVSIVNQICQRKFFIRQHKLAVCHPDDPHHRLFFPAINLPLNSRCNT
jgi:hypothetical protein